VSEGGVAMTRYLFLATIILAAGYAQGDDWVCTFEDAYMFSAASFASAGSPDWATVNGDSPPVQTDLDAVITIETDADEKSIRLRINGQKPGKYLFGPSDTFAFMTNGGEYEQKETGEKVRLADTFYTLRARESKNGSSTLTSVDNGTFVCYGKCIKEEA